MAAEVSYENYHQNASCSNEVVMLTLFKNKWQVLFIRKWVPWCIIKQVPRNGCEPARGFQSVSLLDGMMLIVICSLLSLPQTQ